MICGIERLERAKVRLRGENVEHRDDERIVEIERRESEREFNRAKHTQLIVAVADDGISFDVRTDGDGDGARRVNAVGSVLRAVEMVKFISTRDSCCSVCF